LIGLSPIALCRFQIWETYLSSQNWIFVDAIKKYCWWHDARSSFYDNVPSISNADFDSMNF
jgi:hypothetical protein